MMHVSKEYELHLLPNRWSRIVRDSEQIAHDLRTKALDRIEEKLRD